MGGYSLYQALYRKYRPKKLSDTVGQNVITKTLANSLTNHKTSHAYLFSGPRGTGKTTMAKILAQAINCENLINGEPCGTCSSCQMASSKECVDIVEIDAASNNGVDEIRELKDKINLVPSSLKYKVYIIDEVHMLSIGAFNALLKTLEEPPSHVLFILATTDLHKVPITIISRCQCFSFRRIGIEDLVKRLKDISTQEQIEIDEETLTAIAEYSDGGMRDALGMLDKLSSYSEGKITIENFNLMNGLLSKKDLKEFVNSIFENDLPKTLTLINRYYQDGKDFIPLVDQLLLTVRDLFVEAALQEKTVDYDKKQMFDFIKCLSDLGKNIKQSSNPKILFEVTVVSFMNELNLSFSSTKEKKEPLSLSKQIDEESQKTKPQVSSSSLKEKETVKNPSKGNNNKNFSEKMKIRIHNTFAKADKTILQSYRERWNVLSDYTFDETIGYLVCILLDGTPRVASEETLILSYEYESMVVQAFENYHRLLNVFETIFGNSLNFVFMTHEQWQLEKNTYIQNRKNNVTYEYQEEPEEEKESEILSNQKNDDKMILEPLENSTLKEAEIFGDIVEVN